MNFWTRPLSVTSDAISENRAMTLRLKKIGAIRSAAVSESFIEVDRAFFIGGGADTSTPRELCLLGRGVWGRAAHSFSAIHPLSSPAP